MSKAKEYVLDKTEGLNTLITTEDKIKYLIGNYESPLVNIEELAKILALVVEEEL